METTNRTTLIVIIIAVIIVLIGLLAYRGSHTKAVPANSQTGAIGNSTGTSTMTTGATTTTIVQPDGSTITVPVSGFDQKG